MKCGKFTRMRVVQLTERFENRYPLLEAGQFQSSNRMRPLPEYVQQRDELLQRNYRAVDKTPICLTMRPKDIDLLDLLEAERRRTLGDFPIDS